MTDPENTPPPPPDNPPPPPPNNPPPPPPAPTGQGEDRILTAIGGLTDTVSKLVEILTPDTAPGGPGTDTSPVKPPWTHRNPLKRS
jgi:protein TonB